VILCPVLDFHVLQALISFDETNFASSFVNKTFRMAAKIVNKEGNLLQREQQEAILVLAQGFRPGTRLLLWLNLLAVDNLGLDGGFGDSDLRSSHFAVQDH